MMAGGSSADDKDEIMFVGMCGVPPDGLPFLYILYHIAYASLEMAN